MKVVIVGAGVVGSSLAEQLSAEGHQVAIIDTDRERVRTLNETMEVLAVRGNGALPSVLEGVDTRHADMLIAVTSSDEVNLVTGMVGTRLGVPSRIVRLRSPEYSHDDALLPMRELGIHHVVNPEPFTVESLARMMELPGSYDFATLASGQVEMFGFKVAEDSPAIGRTLKELRELGTLVAFLVLYISRDGKAIVPRGDDTLQRGDKVHVLVSPDTVQFLLPIMCPHPEPTRHVIIVGAERVGIDLALRLEGTGKQVAIIESDVELAEEAAHRLKKGMVLRGEGTDLGLLEEASIDKCDFFCALSQDDDRNMLATLLAKKNGADRTAVMVRRPAYVPVLDSLGVDIVLNPRFAIVGEIMRYLRRGRVSSVTRLAESRGEIIEMEAPERCKAVGCMLKKMKFPSDALVGAIVRNGEMQIPNGDSTIEPEDKVLIYALPDAIPTIEKLFGG